MENSDLVFTLSDLEKEHLTSQLGKITYDPAGGAHYLNALRKTLYAHLPERILDALNEHRSSLRPLPYFVIENVPCDYRVYKTPLANENSSSAKSSSLSENILIGIATLVGEPYSIRFEGENIVNDLVPFQETCFDYTGLGSQVELDFHIENAALKSLEDFNFSPMGLLLTGVRHDPKGPLTRLSDARKAIKNLSRDDLALLQSPLYRLKLPHRWRVEMENLDFKTAPTPLIKGGTQFPEISAVFYPDMVETENDFARAAMLNFYQLIKANSFGIDVAPGRLVYVDNRFTLHSRDKFTPTLDSEGRPLRWVQRCFVAANLWNHRNLRQIKSRVFEFTGRN